MPLVGIQKRTQKLYEGSLNSLSLSLPLIHSDYSSLKIPKPRHTYLTWMYLTFFSESFKPFFVCWYTCIVQGITPKKGNPQLFNQKCTEKRVKESQKRRERLKSSYCAVGDRYECIGEESPDETITSQQHQTACIKRARFFLSISLTTLCKYFWVRKLG